MFIKLNKQPTNSSKWDLIEEGCNKIFKNGESIICVEDDEEIFFDKTKNKIFILKGDFFDDCFEEKLIKKKLCLEYFASLNDKDLINFLESSDGFYSLIILDCLGNDISIYSDHIDSEPMFFSNNSDQILVSHELKNILGCTTTKLVKRSKVIDYFMFLHTSSGETFYKNIYRTLPRMKLIISSDKIIRNIIFSFKSRKPEFKTEKEYSVNLRKLFYRSVNNCVGKDTKISCALSGGLDSSSIASVLKDQGHKDVLLTTAIFEGKDKKKISKTDETKYSSNVANSLGFKQKKINIKNTGCITSYEEIKEIFSEPASLVNGYIHYEIFKYLKSKNYRIYLDGFGGDSVISHGYSKLFELAKNFRFGELIKQDRQLHKKKGAKYSILRTLRKYAIPSIFPSRVLWILDSFRKTKNPHKSWIKRINLKNINGSIYRNLIVHFGRYPGKIKSAQDTHLANLNSLNISFGVQHASQLGKSCGIKVYFPFLSKKLMQASLDIPVNLKLKDGIDRYIFREAMRGIVPEEVLNRTNKSDLSALSSYEISKIDKSKIIALLKSKCGDLFNYEYIEKEIFSNNEANFTEIFQIYEFVKWLENGALQVD